MQTTTDSPAVPADRSEAAERRRRRKWPYVVGAVVLVPVLGAGVYYAAQLGSGGEYLDADGDYTHVEPGSSIRHLVGHPAFDDFSDSMRLFQSPFLGTITAPMAIDSITTNAGTITDGANFVIDAVNAGVDVHHPLYSDEEVARDPAKAASGLYFFPGDPGAPVAVVLPGGAFLGVATTIEGFPYAAELHDEGYNVFVLEYRVGVQEGESEDDMAARAKRAQEDLLAAMVRIEGDPEFAVTLEDYSIWGSSAGGTLALLWGTDSELGASANGFPTPTAIVTAYPAALEWPGPAETFPPLFVTMAEDDELIPIEEVDDLVAGLETAGVAVEYDRVAAGGHGYGVGGGGEAEGWMQDAIAFWQSRQ